MPNFAYKSFCWSVGTTSFRKVGFNARIERRIALLGEFWALPENAAKKWRAEHGVLQKDVGGNFFACHRMGESFSLNVLFAIHHFLNLWTLVFKLALV